MEVQEHCYRSGRATESVLPGHCMQCTQNSIPGSCSQKNVEAMAKSPEDAAPKSRSTGSMLGPLNHQTYKCLVLHRHHPHWRGTGPEDEDRCRTTSHARRLIGESQKSVRRWRWWDGGMGGGGRHEATARTGMSGR